MGKFILITKNQTAPSEGYHRWVHAQGTWIRNKYDLLSNTALKKLWFPLTESQRQMDALIAKILFSISVSERNIEKHRKAEEMLNGIVKHGIESDHKTQ